MRSRTTRPDRRVVREDRRRLDGRSAPDGAADLTLAHLTDLHGRLGPSHQVCYDSPRSRPDIEFDGDRTVRPVRGLAAHVAKLSERQSDGAPVDSGETYRVATFRRPAAPDRDIGGCDFPFRNARVEREVMGLVEPVGEGARGAC